MAYPINFDGLERDICTLSAWMLSYEGAHHLDKHLKLKSSMIFIHRQNISSLLLSITAQLRIIRDTTKDKPTKHDNLDCGEISHNIVRYENNTESSSIGKNISFRNVLDKILHATIKVERFSQVSSEGKALVIQITGKEKSGEDWEVQVDILKFCEIAVLFLENKKLSYEDRL